MTIDFLLYTFSQLSTDNNIAENKLSKILKYSFTFNYLLRQ